MDHYIDIANSSFIYLLGAIVVGFVVVQSLLFLRIAWREGLKIGLDKKTMLDTVKSSVIFSIVPSIAILLSLIAMAAILGVPFSWIRLSVVGSMVYELIAADIAADAMGVSGFTSEAFTAEVFANAVWVMSVGIIWGLIFCVFFLKKYQRKMSSFTRKDSGWGEILVASLFVGVLSAFVGEPIVQGGVPLATLLSGALIMFILIYIIRRWKVDWLNNFSFSISMICAMALAIWYVRLF